MNEEKSFSHLVNHCMEYLPPALQDLKKTAEQHCRQLLQNMLARLNLVTRQEFDAQKAVLARTREKLDKLEHIIATADPTRENSDDPKAKAEVDSTRFPSYSDERE